MAKEEVKIRDLIDSEIIQLVQICYALFNSGYLSDFQLTAFTNVLRHKFPSMTYGQVMKLCEEAAAHPPQGGIKFTPSFLSVILTSNRKEYSPINNGERVFSQEERNKYRQEFLNDLYEDFNDYKNGKLPARIHAYQYVAILLERYGYVEKMPDIRYQELSFMDKLRGKEDGFDGYRVFVLECYDRMIKNDTHISQIINGTN